MTSQSAKAEQFLAMHQQGGLLLPNAWDVSSARIFAEADFPAIATTSAGVAFACGYPDGQRISREEMLAVIARIVAAVQVPVTADVEAGYGDSPRDVEATVRGVLDSGVVGINLEDDIGQPNTLYTQDAEVERIAAAREQAVRMGISLVINARTDVYLAQIGAPETRLDETLRRARAYQQAGADSIFVPGVVDPALIQVLVREIPAPLNILVGPGAPSAPELFAMGVARLSVGSAAMRATMGLTRAIAHELRQQGTYEQLDLHPYPYPDATALFMPAPPAE
jgi:2-methylisocitrate lyase-like PEP mutase family enzyme